MIYMCMYTSGVSHRSLIGVNEEDLDDDFKLPPACLCNLIGRLGHHWKKHSEWDRQMNKLGYVTLQQSKTP